MENQEFIQRLIDYDKTRNNQYTLEQWIKASEDYYNINKHYHNVSDNQFDEIDSFLKEYWSRDNTPLGVNIYNLLMKGIFTDNGIKTNHLKDDLKTLQVSLNKIKYKTLFETKTELKKFFEKSKDYQEFKKQGRLPIFYIAPKLDGISIKLIFDENQKITHIQTRGGQNVYQELILNESIRYWEGKTNNKYIHGELVISKNKFKEKYSEQYENMRNCIVGVMKTNPEDLTFIPCTNGIEPILLQNDLWKSFDINGNINLENLYFNFYKTDKFPYLTDGIVIGHLLGNISNFEIVNNYPSNITAVKFKSESVKTQVIDIEWTIKKSGKLTPILHVKPVHLDGSEIRKVSGYSFDTLKSKRIGIGSDIMIHKSGDIIPTVDKVISRSTEFKLPTDIEFKVDGKHIYVINDSEEQKINKFNLGLKLLELDGIGPNTSQKIGELFDYDIIQLFDKNKSVDIKLMLGENSSLWNKFNQFYSIKTIPLDLLIEMLQFDKCGKTLSRKFADIMLGISKDTKGINKELLKSVCSSSGEYNKIIKESINKLKLFGVKVIKPIQISEDSFTFEMSGDVPNGLTKEKFIEQLKQRNPNAIHTTLTKNTKYLFVDSLESNSSKANKARKYNIELITYTEALNKTF